MAGTMPLGANSERLYAWHLRIRGVVVDRWALFDFVFYRVRRYLHIEHQAGSHASCSPRHPWRFEYSCLQLDDIE
jgi:hypothetical protein